MSAAAAVATAIMINNGRRKPPLYYSERPIRWTYDEKGEVRLLNKDENNAIEQKEREDVERIDREIEASNAKYAKWMIGLSFTPIVMIVVEKLLLH